MANSPFAKFTHGLGRGYFNLDDATGDELRVALIDTASYVANVGDAGHEYLSSVGAAGILTSMRLAYTYVARLLDFTDFVETFFDPGGGLTGEALLVVQHKPVSHAITDFPGAKTFVVAGSNVARFPKGWLVTVTGSTGNNGDYHVASVSFDGISTFIEVVEVPPSGVADGNIEGVDPTIARLMFWFDTVTGLPVTLDGVADSITWNAAGVWLNNTLCP